MANESFSELLEQFANEDREEIDSYRQARETLPIGYFFRSESSSSQLNSDFVWFQFFIEILLRMKPTVTAMQDLVDVCLSAYEDNSTQQRLIREFQREYHNTDAIKWYTRDSFLYRQINKALREQDTSKLFAFRLFIVDAYHQLEQKHEEQRLSSSMSLLKRTWRGQLMAKAEADRLRAAKGALISIHSFFSTSVHCIMAQGYMDAPEGSISVLFEIEIDTSLVDVKPFADVSSLSYMPKEGEILFMMGTIFRILDVTDDDFPNTYWVKMQLCSDDTEFKPTIDHLKSRINEKTCIYDFAVVLFEMGLLDQAKKTCQQLLPIYPSNGLHAVQLHRLLGQIAHDQACFDTALDHFDQAMRVEEQLLLTNDIERAKTLMNLALTQKALGERAKALKHTEQALAIFKRSDGEYYEFIAACLSNIGIIFIPNQPYQALACFFHALFIRRRYLPTADVDIALNIGNIGSVMGILGNHQQELNIAQQTLRMLIPILPSMDAQIALAHQNVGAAYDGLCRYEEGLVAYHKAAAIFEQIYKPDHPRCVQIQEGIRRMFLKRVYTRLTTRMDMTAMHILTKAIAERGKMSKDDANKLKQRAHPSENVEFKDESLSLSPNQCMNGEISATAQFYSKQASDEATVLPRPSLLNQPTDDTGMSEPMVASRDSSDQSTCVEVVATQLNTIHMHRNNTLEEKLNACRYSSYLDLTEVDLRDQDVPTIIQRAFQEIKCTSLSLSKNSLTSAGAKMLLDGLIETNHTTLKGLSLKGNFSLGKHQMQEVARLLKSKCLTLIELSLSKGALTDEEMIFLCDALERNTTLQHFYAPTNKEITDACVDSLIRMLEINKTLQGLYFPLCSLSNDGQKRLKQATKGRKSFVLIV